MNLPSFVCVTQKMVPFTRLKGAQKSTGNLRVARKCRLIHVVDGLFNIVFLINLFNLVITQVDFLFEWVIPTMYAPFCAAIHHLVRTSHRYWEMKPSSACIAQNARL